MKLSVFIVLLYVFLSLSLSLSLSLLGGSYFSSDESFAMIRGGLFVFCLFVFFSFFFSPNDDENDSVSKQIVDLNIFLKQMFNLNIFFKQMFNLHGRNLFKIPKIDTNVRVVYMDQHCLREKRESSFRS